LYQKIRECNYSLPPILTDPAKDLIFRMLQADPMNRITITEIKQHKWFNNQINLYQKIDNYKYLYGNLVEVDQSIIDFMKSLDINFDGLDEEKIKASIMNRERKEFCIIYEYLEFSKTKKQNAEKKETLKSKQTLTYRRPALL
jgi:5'-AMP-activated protein kinase catalytic alpha subunit